MRTMNPREGRNWPGYLFGGRLRTSTAVLLTVFCAAWWVYQTYDADPAPPTQVPASEVVPPGFVPDPNYTWAPRTDVQSRSSATPTTSGESTTPTTATSSPASSTTSAPDAVPSTSSTAPSTTTVTTVPTPVTPTTSAPSTSAAVPGGGAEPTPEPSTR